MAARFALKVSDFCATALTETAPRTIAEHETLTLSDCDPKAFFDALAEHDRRVAS